MPPNMSVTFLGTSSGGGPSASRNCSSLVADVVGDGSLWMVDCAEGTLRQIDMQPRGQRFVKAMKVKKIFITHMHADHVMGIVTFLRNVLYPPRSLPGASPNQTTARKPPHIELYGPAGLRTFVRSLLTMTLTKTSERYVVHELLTRTDVATPCTPESAIHSSECVGQDIRCAADGFWRGITSGTARHGSVVVDAGPILHRDPCIGYVFRETAPPMRKLVILGDTYDASSIIPLATSPVPSLLIHEATDACIPRQVDPEARRRPEAVTEKALERGHSTPTMAGEFARRVGAERLVLNHIGSRFPAPFHSSRKGDIRTKVMREIERQASEAWGLGRAQAATDYMRIVIPAPPRPELQDIEQSFDLQTASHVVNDMVVEEALEVEENEPQEADEAEGWAEYENSSGGAQEMNSTNSRKKRKP